MYNEITVEGGVLPQDDNFNYLGFTMTNQQSNITPIMVFTDLLDGYSPSRLADQISHIDPKESLLMAEKAIKAMRSENPTDQEQKDALTVLEWIYDGVSASDLEIDHGVDSDDAEKYMEVIMSGIRAKS